MEQDDRLIALIEAILPKFEQVAASWSRNENGYGGFQNIVLKHALEMEVCALADYVYGSKHPNAEMIRSAIGGSTMTHLQSAQGLLMGTASAIRNGLLDDLQTKILLDVQSDFIDAARAALENDSKDVAAVLLCVVLEDSVKRLATKSNQDQLLGKEFSVVVLGLFKASTITKATKGVLLSHTDLRNSAMHAQWDEVSAESVQSLLGFLPMFIEHHGI
jgi:hypothetical protein